MVKDGYKIGKKKVVDGETLYSPEYYDNGCCFGTIYKDSTAFYNNPDEVCYVPEHAFDFSSVAHVDGEDNYYVASGYTRRDLENLIEGCEDADGDSIDIEDFFDSLIWCCPETRLSEISY